MHEYFVSDGHTRHFVNHRDVRCLKRNQPPYWCWARPNISNRISKFSDTQAFPYWQWISDI